MHCNHDLCISLLGAYRARRDRPYIKVVGSLPSESSWTDHHISEAIRAFVSGPRFVREQLAFDLLLVALVARIAFRPSWESGVGLKFRGPVLRLLDDLKGPTIDDGAILFHHVQKDQIHSGSSKRIPDHFLFLHPGRRFLVRPSLLSYRQRRR